MSEKQFYKVISRGNNLGVGLHRAASATKTGKKNHSRKGRVPITRFTRKAMRKLAYDLNCVDWKVVRFAYFVTLTLPPRGPRTISFLKEKINALGRKFRLAKNFKELEGWFFVKYELHQRDGAHAHLMIGSARPLEKELLQEAWDDLCGSSDVVIQIKRFDAALPTDREAVISYMTKQPTHRKTANVDDVIPKMDVVKDVGSRLVAHSSLVRLPSLDDGPNGGKTPEGNGVRKGGLGENPDTDVEHPGRFWSVFNRASIPFSPAYLKKGEIDWDGDPKDAEPSVEQVAAAFIAMCTKGGTKKLPAKAASILLNDEIFASVLDKLFQKVIAASTSISQTTSTPASLSAITPKMTACGTATIVPATVVVVEATEACEAKLALDTLVALTGMPAQGFKSLKSLPKFLIAKAKQRVAEWTAEPDRKAIMAVIRTMRKFYCKEQQAARAKLTPKARKKSESGWKTPQQVFRWAISSGIRLVVRDPETWHRYLKHIGIDLRKQDDK